MAEEKTVLRVSVRDLVQFCLISGSITTGGGPGSVQDMLDGTAVHRKLQKLAEDKDRSYESEVRCEALWEEDDLALEVRGQMDGVSRVGETVRIDEIKATRAPKNAPDEAELRLYRGQLKTYGWMLCRQEGLEKVSLQLIRYHLTTGDILREESTLPAAELESFFGDMCREYLVWQRKRLEAIRERNRTAEKLAFPFDFRPGQRTAAGQVYRTLRDGRRLMLQAPTGIGKTLATLFPAVKAQAEGAFENIFYLTAKISGREAACQAVRQLEEKGLRCHAVQLVSKERSCPHEMHCNPEDCPLADGYYDRFRDGVRELLRENSLITPEILGKVSEKYSLCPHELALDCSDWCDIIIGDYNHLIDPTARLTRFFGDGLPPRHAVLADEAHNLVERGREAFSAELDRRSLDEAGKTVKEKYPSLQKKISRLCSPFRKKSKEMKDSEGKPLPRAEGGYPVELVEAARVFCESYLGLLREESFRPYADALRDLYFRADALLTVSEMYNEKYTTLWERKGGNLSVRLFCADPSEGLRKCFDRTRSTILFSGTLLPRDYFSALLSDEPTDWAEIPSPFPPENLLVLFGEPVSTRYRDREKSYDRVAEIICRAISHKVGNYMVFFPSFAYMEEILSRFPEEPGFDLAVQKSRMEDGERDAFLARFREYGRRTLLGACVVGGIFAEGVDLSGEQLSGAIVVGVGLPTVSFETEVLRERLDTDGNGYRYAYQCPGINRVFQAAGRVIRSETDRGFLLLLDDRYRTGEYIRTYPPSWSHNLICRNREEMDEAIRRHFSTGEEPQ